MTAKQEKFGIRIDNHKLIILKTLSNGRVFFCLNFTYEKD